MFQTVIDEATGFLKTFLCIYLRMHYLACIVLEMGAPFNWNDNFLVPLESDLHFSELYHIL